MSENQKKIWITGASSGIGKALALEFSNKNWKVAISARRENLLNDLANNKNIFAYPLDVTNDKKTVEVFNKITSDFDGLDICVFCSGTYNRKS
jgi:NADP-dependent 3-hydroxy acid dehydrogenase YdfG